MDNESEMNNSITTSQGVHDFEEENIKVSIWRGVWPENHIWATVATLYSFGRKTKLVNCAYCSYRMCTNHEAPPTSRAIIILITSSAQSLIIIIIITVYEPLSQHFT